MNQKIFFALAVFVLSMLALLTAAIFEIPVGYVALIPVLAGSCIAAFHIKSRED